MSVQNDILLAVIGMAEQTEPYTDIIIGALPVSDGLCMQISSGAPATTFLNKGMPYEFNVVFNGKHSNQQTVSDTMNNIHLALTQTKNYPQTDEYQITDIETITTPFYLDREDQQWLYGSSLRIKAYIY